MALKKIICILTIVLLTLVNLTLIQAASSSHTQNFIEIIDQTTAELLKKYHVPGVAVAIVENNDIIFSRGFGVGNKQEDWPITADTVFQVGSIAKSLAALGIMGLVSEGYIDLDAPAEKYLTQWTFPDSRFDSQLVTVRRLLNHTAGVSPRGYIGYSPWKEIPSLWNPLLDKPALVKLFA